MIIKKTILLLFVSYVFLHEVDDSPEWKQYYRGSYIVDENHDSGLGIYYRLNRKTKYTFRDIRAYLHFIKDYQYKKIRYKASNKFINFSRFYNYSTISIDQNSKIGIDIRYHGNQGIGFFVKESNNSHINTEFALAYDISDYLNDSRKTSYIKSGLYYDKKFSENEIKLEIEYYSQITDLIDNVDLSRIEILFESYFQITDNLSLIVGYELESFESTDDNFNSSIFLSIGYDNIFNVDKIKKRLLK
jgi:hypothetical protein